MKNHVALLVLVLVLGCGSSPAPTGTVCPDPDPQTLTWDSFGNDFMTRYCTWCHDSSLPRSQRNGAPLYHDYDTLLGVLKTPEHIDEQAGHGPDARNHFMPPDRCPSVPGGPIDRDCPAPTDAERRQLAEWVACEKQRGYTPVDARAGAP